MLDLANIFLAVVRQKLIRSKRLKNGKVHISEYIVSGDRYQSLVLALYANDKFLWKSTGIASLNICFKYYVDTVYLRQHFSSRRYSTLDTLLKAHASYISTLPANVITTLDSLKIFRDLAAFRATNVKKHYGELKGWHIEAPKETAEEEKTRQAMTVVLIDNDHYQ
jgi:hypothetical protein